MTGIDRALPAPSAIDAGRLPERAPQDASRRFARCVSIAQAAAALERPAAAASAGDPIGLPMPAAGAAPGDGPAAGSAQLEAAGSRATVVCAPCDIAVAATGKRDGPGEAPDLAVPDAARPHSMQPSVEAMAGRPTDSEAAALARALFRELPLAEARERTLTVSFPAAAGAVERIVLSGSGGVLSLVVTARAEARARVAEALPELVRLLRSRGLRVGSVALD